VAATLEALTLLVDHGVDIRAFNTGGETALHIAADRGLEPVTRFLVEHGARTQATDKRGRTPLDMALGVGSAPGTRGTAPNRESTVAYLRTVTSAAPPVSRQ
jgi:ankyrin repeat protein